MGLRLRPAQAGNTSMDGVHYTERESEQVMNVQLHSSTDQNKALKDVGIG